jgi:hypothetical protein
MSGLAAYRISGTRVATLSGADRAAASRCSKNVGETTRSGFARSAQGASARASPCEAASPYPPFTGFRTSTSASVSPTRSTASSSDALSTTTSWRRAFARCAASRSESAHATSESPEFHATMTALTS